ncbi:Gfo/Idh/MocA family protein [Kosakonia pseudosacchari]|uniref:Oxidoreductase n=1 Tax=Kosakonia pseudosacchari TaxID=1646340 RepID=A0ABX4IWX6_9ENTR|nr:Gfo/Idh/MocA family oxidoreductase [Kosakonia pseudosacchari]PDO90216.1 oxidoreductase [Kosakonia pseudosacchari]
MAKPLSLAFIGGGLNSAIGMTHKIASQMDGHFQLSAGCFSRDDALNRQTGMAWGLDESKIYQDALTLLEKEHAHLDAVVVLTPTPAHREILMACLEYPLPIICEKALVASVKDAEDIQQRVDEVNSQLYVTFNYTGYPMVRELRQRLQSGALGRIQHVMVEMPQEGFSRCRSDGSIALPQTWRRTDNAIPTVSLDLGVHVHQLVEFLTEKHALDVYAVNSTFARVPGVVDTVNIVSRYSDDVVCNYWYGKAALGYRNGLRIRVYGTEGSAEWLQMEPEYLRIADIHGNVSIIDRTASDNTVANQERYCRFKAGHPAGFIEAFANYYCDIAAALRGEANSYAIGSQVALKGLAFLESANKSALAQQKIIL